MKTKSSIAVRIVMPLFLCLLICVLTGCKEEEPPVPFDMACVCYNEGRYEDADPWFAAAIDAEPDNMLIHLGYGFNLLKLGRTDDVLDQFIPIFDTLMETREDDATLKRVAVVIFDICYDKGLYSRAADLCDMMSGLVTDEEEIRYYRLRDAMLRAKRYKGNEEMFFAWIVAVEDVISFKTYALDELCELYTAYAEHNMRAEQLELAKRMDAYMMGHSAYADSFDRLIEILFDSASIASDMAIMAAASENSDDAPDPEYYFAAAEKYVSMSAERNLPDEAILKYKIIMAERRGKFDVAYKLLGVYLNNCPDDEAALKERDYIRVRLGVSDD